MVMNYLRKKREFNRIVKAIKNVKIQGARNIAKAALKAYHLFPTKKAKKELLRLRPTEPMLVKVLDLADKKPYKEILNHFDQAQEKINKNVLKLIKSGDVIFTHCHSTNVVNALIYAKRIVDECPYINNLTGIKRGIEDVFSDFDTSQIKHRDMQPFFVFSFGCEITYSNQYC